MQLLTVTTDTQGRRGSDACAAIDGELVTFAETNDCDKYEPTSPWPRSFQGLSSGELTTTAIVRDVPLDDADLRMAVRGYLENHRAVLDEDDDETEVEDLIAEWAAELKAAGAAHPPGTVLERWWDTLTPRGSGPLGPQSRPRYRRTRW